MRARPCGPCPSRSPPQRSAPVQSLSRGSGARWRRKGGASPPSPACRQCAWGSAPDPADFGLRKSLPGIRLRVRYFRHAEGPSGACRRPCATQETCFANLPVGGRKGGVHASCELGHSPARTAAADRPLPWAWGLPKSPFRNEVMGGRGSCPAAVRLRRADLFIGRGPRLRLSGSFALPSGPQPCPQVGAVLADCGSQPRQGRPDRSPG